MGGESSARESRARDAMAILEADEARFALYNKRVQHHVEYKVMSYT